MKVLLDDGGNIYACNFYKNYPIDFAKPKETIELLTTAEAETPVPLTDKDILIKHEKTIGWVGGNMLVLDLFSIIVYTNAEWIKCCCY